MHPPQPGGRPPDVLSRPQRPPHALTAPPPSNSPGATTARPASPARPEEARTGPGPRGAAAPATDVLPRGAGSEARSTRPRMRSGGREGVPDGRRLRRVGVGVDAVPGGMRRARHGAGRRPQHRNAGRRAGPATGDCQKNSRPLLVPTAVVVPRVRGLVHRAPQHQRVAVPRPDHISDWLWCDPLSLRGAQHGLVRVLTRTRRVSVSSDECCLSGGARTERAFHGNFWMPQYLTARVGLWQIPESDAEQRTPFAVRRSLSVRRLPSIRRSPFTFR